MRQVGSFLPIRFAPPRDRPCHDVAAILWLPRRKSECNFREHFWSFKINSQTRHIAGRTYVEPAGRAGLYARAAGAGAATFWQVDALNSAVHADIRAR